MRRQSTFPEAIADFAREYGLWGSLIGGAALSAFNYAEPLGSTFDDEMFGVYASAGTGFIATFSYLKGGTLSRDKRIPLYAKAGIFSIVGALSAGIHVGVGALGYGAVGLPGYLEDILL